MSNIIQGVPTNYTDPPGGGGGIGIEATSNIPGKRELKVRSADGLSADERREQILLGILNELRILNDWMFRDTNFDSERTGFAYEALELYRNRR